MDKIGTYQILEVLHRGPQPLYRAKGKDGKEVAIKAVPVAGLSPEMRERFTREAETAKKLDHPNLVRVFDAGEADGMLYQAMELLVGSDLGHVFAEGRKFSWEDKLSIMEQVCDGLQFAHEHHLVHRDIKPANLFLENTGKVRVLDFGMVRVQESELTKVGSSLGTLNYMSPEQIRGDRCTPASDVFSVGIVFYQLVTGRHPFSSKDRNLAKVVSAIVFETPPKISELCPDAPEGLEFILNKAMEKDQVNRIQNAGDLKQALSLCRITMKLGLSQNNAAKLPETRPYGGTPGPDPQARAGAAAQVSPEDDAGKTQVIRKKPASVVQNVPKLPPLPPEPPKPTPVPAPPAPPRPVPPPTPAFKYCSICTTPNPPAATVCRGCGNPLNVSGEILAGTETNTTQWGLWVAIGVAALLAIVLIVVLVVYK
ncbi:MAG TPA: serine/threonine-protein kinase [Bryobacteraceae bacterium]|nr:serine/threonine-protein kinase [Bryobacteraceae bacterium]